MFKKILLILFLLIILIYVSCITSLPDSILLFKGENVNLNTILGLYIDDNYKSVQTDALLNNENKSQKNKINVKLLNIFNVKNIDVNTIPKTKVIPLGNAVGLKLYTTGVLVVGKTEVQGQKPYENSGIEEGDMIIKINEEDITNTYELIENVKKSDRR